MILNQRNKFLIKILILKAKNPELERLHEAASRRLADLRMSKETMTQLNKSKRPKRPRVVEIDDENIAKQNNAELILN